MEALRVDSKDGTSIHCRVYGAGRPLLLVSGALFPSERWLAVVPHFASREVYVMDRRGRGESGDQPAYAPQREVEDLQAVLRGIARPVDVLGHSSGAILALELAISAPPELERLVVYEPPVFYREPDLIAPDLVERLSALLQAQRAEAAVETFLQEGPRVPEAHLVALKASPAWQKLVRSLGHTVPYDASVQRSFAGTADELRRVHVPTLMLIGAASPERMRHGALTIAERLPSCRRIELEAQQHMAMVQAPEPFASAVNGFLS